MTRLKFLRITRRLSQDVVSEKTRIPRAHVSMIENGRMNPRPEQLAALAALFQWPAETLLAQVEVNRA